MPRRNRARALLDEESELTKAFSLEAWASSRLV